MIILDLFCGRWGWSRAFAKLGWKCIGVDLTEPPETPKGCEFVTFNVLNLRTENGTVHGAIFEDDVFCGNWKCRPDAIVASPPCEEFSVHGMKHFHPNPKYPENGIRLFNHTRQLCEAANVPYVIENVRAAQQFVGTATHHCGPFYLWGNAVPPLLPRGITKGTHDVPGVPINRSRHYYRMRGFDGWQHGSQTKARKEARASIATIPPELANTVAEYFELILEKQAVSAGRRRL